MITLEALLYLVFGLSTGRLIHAPMLMTFLVNKSPAVLYNLTVLNLMIDLLTFIGFIILVVFARRDSVNHERRQTYILAGLLLATVMMTMFHHVIIRQTNKDSTAILVHDGLVQTEAAAQVVLQGGNPYTTDYRTTDAYGRMPEIIDKYSREVGPLLHYAYPPLIPIIVIPSVILKNIISLNPEGQLIYILIFLAVSGYLAWQAKEWKARRLILVLTVGNPFIWLYIVAGYNDIVASSLAVVAAVSMHRGRFVSAGLLFGLTLAAKQTWWITIPLWVIWLWRIYRSSDRLNQLSVRKSVLITLLTVAVLYGPFIIWNASAMYDDLVRFVLAPPTAYNPISGSTFWQLAVITVAPSSPWRATAHSLTQLIVGVPVLVTMCWWMVKKSTASTWLTAVVILMLSLTVVNRYAYDNYFAALIFVAVAAYALEHFTVTPKHGG